MIDDLIPLADAATMLGVAADSLRKRLLRTGRVHPLVTTIVHENGRIFLDRMEVQDAVLAARRVSAS